jgi:hypothetical protein
VETDRAMGFRYTNGRYTNGQMSRTVLSSGRVEEGNVRSTLCGCSIYESSEPWWSRETTSTGWKSMVLRQHLTGRDPRPSGQVRPRASAGRRPRDRRTRILLRKLGALPTYAEQLGLDVANPSDWFPWFMSASLFAKPIALTTAHRTSALLLRSGIRTPTTVEQTGWDGLVRLLDQGGYVRYDFSTADKLLGIAESLRDPETLRVLAREPSYAKVEDRLTHIRGVGPKTVEIFLRDLQGSWRSSAPWSREARRAARRLGLGLAALPLTASGRRRVENGLVRVWIEHCKPGHWSDCPAGVDCSCRPAPKRVSARVRGRSSDTRPLLGSNASTRPRDREDTGRRGRTPGRTSTGR